MNTGLKWPTRLLLGLAVGAGVAYVDNIAFQGEVSPIIIVGLLLVITSAAGAIGGRPGWVTAFAAWACVPAAHWVKRLLDLPDTLHPNTYSSLLYLAAFTLGVTVIGFGGGLLVHPLTRNDPGRDRQSL